ncbi:multifunctional CCA addition/repair protein [Candidatus Pandoraea novymonadis]|uniref:multifunctional CCA addition/repair protein n=1 Tax=Candidatus Pandoraea novymonadis TaxID=1808959 RepID=UPI000D082490|nr:multifunctional CCA addition/repair protein [Candidatus Pandoraea novymonadis]
MKIYVVGGAIRDELMGMSVKDCDYVVVGSTPEDMLAKGFKPVGRGFPVFLHPETHEEYALARTESKTTFGYHGFVFFYAPSVTLEQDLARRDFTMNAIARELMDDGSLSDTLIDPYEGVKAIEARLFHHVSEAFVDDPVRILRCARFAARFPDFTVAPETLILMRRMTKNGEVDALVPERVWQELSRGLMEKKPSRMLDILRDTGAATRILPEVDIDIHVLTALDFAAIKMFPLPVRFAILIHSLGKEMMLDGSSLRNIAYEGRSVDCLKFLCERLCVPAECRELAKIVVRELNHIHGSERLSVSELVSLLERCDAFRRPKRFEGILQACESLDVHSGGRNTSYSRRHYLMQTLEVARSVNAGIFAERYAGNGAKIKAALHAARVDFLSVWLDVHSD